ncbi:hypothetical protein [Halostella salina]|uniref:hypothetical protein n=1 Tax=Halostella salina TaxID=1547897 RepID=UPI000EF8304B|nr:hypothetical protein [Halostella salina]
MRRRSYLRGLSTTAVGLALAGCSSGGSGDEGPADTGTGGNGTTSSGNGGRRIDAAIAAAIGELNTGLGELSAAQDRFAADESFDFAGVADRVDAARSELDGIEGEPSGEQSTAIEQVRRYASVVAAMNAAFLTLVDAEPTAEDAEAAVDAEEYDRAESLVAELETTTGEAQSTLEGARSDAEGLDPDVLESRESVEVARIREGYAQLMSLANGFNALARANGDLIDGRTALATGRDHADAEEYGEAESAFGRAGDRFEAANGTATSALDARPPERVTGPLELAACRSGHLTTAAEHFAASARAAADGDRSEAADEQDAAEDAVDSAENC